jgi:hypothetical protein
MTALTQQPQTASVQHFTKAKQMQWYLVDLLLLDMLAFTWMIVGKKKILLETQLQTSFALTLFVSRME